MQISVMAYHSLGAHGPVNKIYTSRYDRFQVNGGHPNRQCLLYPKQQTVYRRVPMAAFDPKRTLRRAALDVRK